MSDDITDEQIGDALRTAQKQLSLYFDALVRSGGAVWRLNAAAAALEKIEAIIGKADTP